MPCQGCNRIESQGVSHTRATAGYCQTFNISAESIHKFRRKQRRLNSETIFLYDIAQGHL